MNRDALVRAASREAAGVILFYPIQTKGDIATASDLIAERILDRIQPIICADERERLVLTYDGSAAYAAIAAERDAARAEVAALQVFAQDANDAFTSGRREVLADLRDRVEGLTENHRFDLTTIVNVLALIDEAQP